METKINIAEILKDKPQGTKLYDLLRNIEVELDSISNTDYENIIWCRYNDVNPYDLYGYSTFGTERGWLNGLQILLPSKEMCDWNKFFWKKGDVLVGVGQRIIFEKFIDENYTKFQGKYSLSTYEDKTLVADKRCYTSYFRKLDDSVNVKNYFKEIEERLGGKLNRETLEVEKVQLEFNDGDVIALDTRYINSDDVIVESFIVRGDYKYGDDLKFYAACSNNKETDVVYNSSIMINKTSVRKESLRLATEEEKQQLFSALEKEGKAWDAEKKEIIDLKPKIRFKPFDKVVVFDELAKKWECGMFSHYSKNYEGKEVITCIGGCTYFKVLPFNEETAKLLGTTDDWEG